MADGVIVDSDRILTSVGLDSCWRIIGAAANLIYNVIVNAHPLRYPPTIDQCDGRVPNAITVVNAVSFHHADLTSCPWQLALHYNSSHVEVPGRQAVNFISPNSQVLDAPLHVNTIPLPAPNTSIVNDIGFD